MVSEGIQRTPRVSPKTPAGNRFAKLVEVDGNCRAHRKSTIQPTAQKTPADARFLQPVVAPGRLANNPTPQPAAFQPTPGGALGAASVAVAGPTPSATPNPAAFLTWPAFLAQYYDLHPVEPSSAPALGDGPVGYWSGSWPESSSGHHAPDGAEAGPTPPIVITAVSTHDHPVTPPLPPTPSDAVPLLVTIMRFLTGEEPYSP